MTVLELINMLEYLDENLQVYIETGPDRELAHIREVSVANEGEDDPAAVLRYLVD